MQTARSPPHMQVIRQYLPSGRAALRFNIDATRRGNVARFVNHRCGDPTTALVIVWRCGEFLPVVSLVARRALEVGEEVTWSYGEAVPAEGARGGRSVATGSPKAGAGDGAEFEDAEGLLDKEAYASEAEKEAWREVCLCGSSMCTGVMPLR